MNSLVSSDFVQRASAYADQARDRLSAVPMSFWKGLIVLIALIWMCRNLATLFWLIFPVPEIESPKVIATPRQASASSTGGVSVNISKLQESHLFGEASADLPEAQPQQEQDFSNLDDENARETSLSLELQGIIASNVAEESRAIIADGQNQDIYGIGDEMPQGRNVKLAKILDQRVILDNNGRAESLWLYSEEDFKNAPGNTSTANSEPSPRRPFKPPASRNARTESVKLDAKPSDVPKTLNDVVRFSVYRKDGKMEGYRVRPGRDAKMFEQAGLKTGDIVTSVNGIRVDDPKKIRSVYESLKESSGAQLEVLRDDAPMTINISLDSGG